MARSGSIAIARRQSPPLPWLRAVLTLGAAAGTLFLLARPIKSPLNYYDEGLVLLNATNILHGDIPYRDFWTLYAPGYYYLLALSTRA